MYDNYFTIMYMTRGGSRGGGGGGGGGGSHPTRTPPPYNFKKYDFFGVKSWFFHTKYPKYLF
jgi:hypothetical protein